MKLLTYNQLRERGIPYCREQLRRKARANEFPQPVPLSGRRIAWVEQEIDAWLAERAALRVDRAA